VALLVGSVKRDLTYGFSYDLAQVFCMPAEMLYAWPAVMGKSSKQENFSRHSPKAFEVSAEIEIECELYGCLGKFPPQGRTLRQTS